MGRELGKLLLRDDRNNNVDDATHHPLSSVTWMGVGSFLSVL